jgi:hypothetical protein
MPRPTASLTLVIVRVASRGETGHSVRGAPEACRMAMPVFALTTAHRKDGRFAFGLSWRAMAVVHVVLPVNGVDPSAIIQAPFTRRRRTYSAKRHQGTGPRRSASSRGFCPATKRASS